MLSPKQLEAIAMYVKSTPVMEISKICGVSRTTFYEWMKGDEFKAEVNRQYEEIKNSAAGKITRRVDSYVDELHKLAMTSKSEKTKLDALTYLVDHVIGRSTAKIENVTKDKDTDKDKLTWNTIADDETIKLKVVK